MLCELILGSVVVVTIAQEQMSTLPPASLKPTQVFPESTISVLFDESGSGATTLEPFSTVTPHISSQFFISETDLFEDFVGDGLCPCDLLVSQCDILCCCDRDCTSSDQEVFNCSTTSVLDEVCLVADDIVRTSLVRCTCPDSSLLCVVSEQDPSHLTYGEAVTVVDIEQFTFLESIHTLPNDGPEKLLYQNMYTTMYLVGDPVLTYVSSTYASFLSLPAPLNGFYCHDGNPITYLINRQYKCERPLVPLSSVCFSLSASQYYNKMIVTNPDNFTSFLNILCLTNDSNRQPCQLPPSSYNFATNTCNNAVLQVKYTLIHDGAGILLNSFAEINLGEVVEHQHLVQQFSVEFFKVNNTNITGLRRSGNHGYQKGEQILAGSLTENGDINITLDRTLWLHIMDSARDCTTERSRLPVRFQINLHSTCLMKISPQDLVFGCDQLIMKAYSILTPDYDHQYVGRFGDSGPSNISHWIRILQETTTEVQDFRSYKCFEVPTSLHITILYSNTGDFNAPEMVLSGVKFVYVTQNIPSELVRNGHIMMQSTVKFVDVTPKPVRVLQSIQGTVLPLPQDFLYPFFVSNAYNLISSYSSIIFIIVVYCIL